MREVYVAKAAALHLHQAQITVFEGTVSESTGGEVCLPEGAVFESAHIKGFAADLFAVQLQVFKGLGFKFSFGEDVHGGLAFPKIVYFDKLSVRFSFVMGKTGVIVTFGGAVGQLIRQSGGTWDLIDRSLYALKILTTNVIRSA